jgi:hypothetical protein
MINKIKIVINMLKAIKLKPKILVMGKVKEIIKNRKKDNIKLFKNSHPLLNNLIKVENLLICVKINQKQKNIVILWKINRKRKNAQISSKLKTKFNYIKHHKILNNYLPLNKISILHKPPNTNNNNKKMVNNKTISL